jgi:heptosyltransferase-2
MNSRTEKVLVVGPSWVGDMVMSQSLFRYLQISRPGVRIDVLAPSWSEPILARMPEVHAALELPIGHGRLGWSERRALGRKVREGCYDQAILLPNSFKSALIPFFARIPRRTGWRGELRYGLLNDLRRLDQQALPLMVQRFVALGQNPGEMIPDDIPPPLLMADADNAAGCREKFSLDRDKPLLALCPGAEFGGAKRWPVDSYAALASEYISRGWQVALFGSNNDQQVTAQIRSLAGATDCHDLAGVTSLAEAVDTLSLAAAVVSNDSGLMHIAAALQRPTLVIYGATSPGFTPPLSDRAAYIASDIDCAPCFQRECPLGHHRCMTETSAAAVAGKLDTLLQQVGH